MKKPYAVVKQIQILKKPNWFGQLALNIISFGGWLFDITGNTFEGKNEK